jgi:hypothetical protein
MGPPNKYASELRDRAVRLVQEHADEYSFALGRDVTPLAY